MKWDSDAEEAMRGVPALLRRFVRGQVEKLARGRGLARVTRTTVEEARRAAGRDRRELPEPDPAVIEQLEAELRAAAPGRRVSRTYEVHVCGGAAGCPRSLIPVADLATTLAERIEGSGFPAWLVEGRAGRPLLSHHRFRASVSGCPNACAQPQIHDFGVIGRAPVATATELCQGCGECVLACREGAISVEGGLEIGVSRCLGCGDCVRACPTGALSLRSGGCRVLAGGKLGRHPRLGQEVLACGTAEDVTALLADLLEALQAHGRPGERLGEVLARGTG
jgi:dissimilatory sulfite reductase (desulfoviridin) alpha/beta subunit